MVEATQVERKKAICYWCHCRCRVEAEVRNGRLLEVHADEDHPRTKRVGSVTRSCPRRRAATEWLYHPDRLSYPLKRVGEKGEGKWQQIPWEQALDEIASKLSNIRERYGAEALAVSGGTDRSHNEYKLRFLNLFGSPNNIGQGHICFGPSNMISAAITGWPMSMTAVSQSTKCIMRLGANPEQAQRNTWQMILQNKNAGAKLIVVDPRRTATAERADIWLQLRPGTDTALLMSMINIIIKEELYDKEFVAQWCYGFDRLSERVQDYPPDRVAQITWVPVEKIKQAARMYATTKPASIRDRMGLQQLANSIEALHARYALTAITGNFDVRGGEELHIPPKWIGCYEIELNEKLPIEQRKKQIGSDRFKLESIPGRDLILEHSKIRWGLVEQVFAHAPSVYRAMLTGKPYPVKAMITVSSNPMVTQANTKLVYKAIKNLELYVVMDYWMTPSADLADYVLPAASWLERPNVLTANDLGNIEAGVAVVPHKVEGEYDRGRDYDLWRGLVIRLGQGDYWPWQSQEEALGYRLKSLGYSSVDELVDRTGGSVLTPKEEKKYQRTGFGTQTGKVELYSTILERLGYDPLPSYHEPPESPISTPDLLEKYPLILITGGRHQPFFHSELRQIDSLRRQHPDPIVEINPSKAAELGILDGDWVWIESPRGRVRQKCRYFEGIDPRVVHAQHGWWFPELPGEEPWLHGVWESNVNVLTDDDPEVCNKISGGWPLRAFLCRVYKVKKY